MLIISIENFFSGVHRIQDVKQHHDCLLCNEYSTATLRWKLGLEALRTFQVVRKQSTKMESKKNFRLRQLLLTKWNLKLHQIVVNYVKTLLEINQQP